VVEGSFAVSWSRPEHAAEWKRDCGLRLRSQRLAKGMSQMQLALAADIDPTYISAVEQGRRNVALVNINALAATLRISPRELLSPDVTAR